MSARTPGRPAMVTLAVHAQPLLRGQRVRAPTLSARATQSPRRRSAAQLAVGNRLALLLALTRAQRNATQRNHRARARRPDEEHDQAEAPDERRHASLP